METASPSSFSSSIPVLESTMSNSLLPRVTRPAVAWDWDSRAQRGFPTNSIYGPASARAPPSRSENGAEMNSNALNPAGAALSPIEIRVEWPADVPQAANLAKQYADSLGFPGLQ